MRIWMIALFACAASQKQPPEPAATTVAASLPSNAAPEPPATPEHAKAPAAPAPNAAAESPPQGPMTAAEAAAAAARGAAHPSEGDACATAGDCAFTRIEDGGCCPMLCTPRAVTKTAAEALQNHLRECAQGRACPQPSCAPPRFQQALACESGRCVARPLDSRSLK